MSRKHKTKGFVVAVQFLFLFVMLVYLAVVLVLSIWDGCLVNYAQICVRSDFAGFVLLYAIQFVAAVFLLLYLVRFFRRWPNELCQLDAKGGVAFVLTSMLQLLGFVGKVLLAVLLVFLLAAGWKVLF